MVRNNVKVKINKEIADIVNKYIELEFEIDVIHEILSSGELFELLESMSE